MTRGENQVDVTVPATYTVEEEIARFASTRFLNLDAQKQFRITTAAVSEFADHGYELANTNRIAKNAEVSVGALFKYFATKADLFNYVVTVVSGFIEANVAQLLRDKESVFEVIEDLLWRIPEASDEELQGTRLYHYMTCVDSPGISPSEIAQKWEGFTSRAYTNLIREGQQRGEIRRDVEPEYLALMLDNALVMTQLALANKFFQSRLALYVRAGEGQPSIAPGELNGERIPEQAQKELITSTFAFLKASLANPDAAESRGATGTPSET